MNAFDQMREAIANAKQVDYACAQNANTMANLLSGHLRNVSISRLCEIKRELRLFNIHTGRWRQSK